jgi:periplasmic protein TonB
MSERDLSKYNQEDAEQNKFNNDDLDASEKTVFISRPNKVVDEDHTVIQTPQYSGYVQPDNDATVINLSKNEFTPPAENDATVFLDKPNFQTNQADDATVFLDKPNFQPYKADDATVFLDKPNFAVNKADDSTVILPSQPQPAYQPPQKYTGGDDAATVISRPAEKPRQEERPAAPLPSTESVFSKHKNKIVIGFGALVGLLGGGIILTQTKPEVVVKQEVVQSVPTPAPVVVETPIAPPPAPVAPVENTPAPAIVPAPVVSNVKKIVPKPKVSKSIPTTTYAPTTAPVAMPKAKVETPKNIEEDLPDVPSKSVAESKSTTPQVYSTAQLSQLPEFSDIERYFKRNVKYPDEAKRNKIKGSVFISATIEADGKVSDVKILKGLGSGCDEAAMEAVRKMTKWKPGKANGQNVRSEVSVKVPFQ